MHIEPRMGGYNFLCKGKEQASLKVFKKGIMQIK